MTPQSQLRGEVTEVDIRYLLLFGAVSMAVAQTAPVTPAVAPPKSAAVGASHDSVIRFEDASAKAGINFTHSFGSRQLGSLLEGTGAGCVWLDYNNDGLPDLYVVNGRPLDDSMHPYPLKEKPSPLPHNHLYRNDGNGRFTDVTAKAGLNPDMYSVAVTAADYDNDGCVDFFVGRYVKFDPKYRAYYAADNYPGPLDYEGETNKLYHNNCDGTFTDVSEKSGIAAFVGRTMGVTAADFDGDGWDDIYVANDRTENFLFRNKHDGTFEEVANDTGTAFGQNGESTSSMGPVFADFEGRGVLDLWVTDGHYNRLLHNTGKLGFEDMGAATGVSQTNAQYVSLGTGGYDFDNDGLLDILIFHGGLIHLIPQEHTLFRGLGDGKFADVSRDAGPVLSVRTTARGACFADYDNDGKVDAYVVNLGANGTLVHNVSTNTGHWIAIKLKGTKSNRDGIGARVEVFAGGKRQTAEHVASSGYLSQDDSRMHFGLGAAAIIDKLIVHWPSGREQTLEKVASDRVLTGEEPKG